METPKKPTKKVSQISNVKPLISGLENILNYIYENNNSQKGLTKKSIQAPIKIFKQLNNDEKDSIVRYTGDLMRQNFFQNKEFKSQIYKFSLLFGQEKDWEHIHLLLDYLFVGSLQLDFISKICQTAFAIIDDECAIENNSSFIIGTCLALISEIGIQLNEHREKSSDALKIKYSLFIETITSNMLARSNINNETVRIGLVYYFSKIEPNSQLHLQKILGRFGQSLLEHVLQTYFANSKKSQCAFYFIVEHLDNFIFSSPALAEMSNAVLQNQMLKNPQEFPLLLKKYISYKLKFIDFNLAKSLVIHLSFLLKEACEVNQKALIDSMLEMTFSFIYVFESKSKNTIINLYEILGDIISTSKSNKAKEITHLIYDKIIANNKILESSMAYKLIHLDSKSIHWYQKNKNPFNADNKPSPLEEILLLAS